jgi:uncharacterized protein YwgA
MNEPSAKKPPHSNMTTNNIVHLTLHAFESASKEKPKHGMGRPKLQGILYFIGLLTGMNKKLDYCYHFLGPYSASVSASIMELEAMGFLQKTTGSRLNTEGQPRKLLVLTDDGRAIAEQKAKKQKNTWEKIQKAVETLNSAGNLDPVKIAIAAKAWYMATHFPEISLDTYLKNILPDTLFVDFPLDSDEIKSFLARLGFLPPTTKDEIHRVHPETGPKRISRPEPKPPNRQSVPICDTLHSQIETECHEYTPSHPIPPKDKNLS